MFFTGNKKPQPKLGFLVGIACYRYPDSSKQNILLTSGDVNSMECKCDEKTWGIDGPTRICATPFFDEFDVCAICSHDKSCHETATNSEEVPSVKEYKDRL